MLISISSGCQLQLGNLLQLLGQCLMMVEYGEERELSMDNVVIRPELTCGIGGIEIEILN